MRNDVLRPDPSGIGLAPPTGRGRDVVGGLLLVLLGGAVAYTSTGYNLGTLTRMGPGFVPAALGVILVLVGLVLLATALFRGNAPPVGSLAAAVPGVMIGPSNAFTPEWRGWICICLGVILFAVLSEHTGLIPATAISVFVTALGDRENTPRGAALLAAGMTVGAVAVFWWGLGVLLPLVKWDFG